MIITTLAKITEQYGEYFYDLLHKEAKRPNKEPIPPVEQQFWGDTAQLKRNQEVWNKITGGKSIVEEMPMMEEMIHTLTASDLNSKGRTDLVINGPMQATTDIFGQFLLGIVGIMWVQTFIPEHLKVVVLYAIPKLNGDPLSIDDKQGIGTASKFVLLLKGIFFLCLENIIEKAGIRPQE